jgi:hypothetical protein
VGAKGVYLIWVEEVIKPQLNDKLRYQIISDLFQGWVKHQIEEAEAVTNLDLGS